VEPLCCWDLPIGLCRLLDFFHYGLVGSARRANLIFDSPCHGHGSSGVSVVEEVMVTQQGRGGKNWEWWLVFLLPLLVALLEVAPSLLAEMKEQKKWEWIPVNF
jgi:hypothetical protein